MPPDRRKRLRTFRSLRRCDKAVTAVKTDREGWEGLLQKFLGLHETFLLSY